MRVLPKKFCENVLTRVQDTLVAFDEILFKIGLTDRDSWLEQFDEEITACLESILADAHLKYEELLNKIEQRLVKADTLCKKLGIIMPSFGSKDMGLYKEAQELQCCIDEWEALLENRLKEINEIKTKRDILCNEMGREPFEICENPLPTQKDIEAYVLAINSLEVERNSRYTKFVTIKKEIMQFVKLLDFKPMLNFQRLVVEEETIGLDDEHMENLHEFHLFLKTKVDGIVNEIGECRERLDVLWQIIEEDRKYISEFTGQHRQNSMTTLLALKEELKRCDVIKKSHIEKLIIKMKEMLLEQWELCGYTQEQRDEFKIYGENVFTEDVLMRYELEVDKLKKFRSDNKEIFDSIQKLNELWTKYDQLEKKANDPNRYKNRGGNLLKEEKERNAVNKNIPTIEDQLIQHAIDYENKTGKEFTYLGETVQSFVDRNRAKRNDEKKLKSSARKVNDTTTRAKTPIKKTPLKPIRTPLAKLNSARSASTRKVARRSITKKKECVSEQKKLQTRAKLMAETESEYNAFASCLSARRSQRSTMAQDSPRISETPAKAGPSKKLF